MLIPKSHPLPSRLYSRTAPRPSHRCDLLRRTTPSPSPAAICPLPSPHRFFLPQNSQILISHSPSPVSIRTPKSAPPPLLLSPFQHQSLPHSLQFAAVGPQVSVTALSSRFNTRLSLPATALPPSRRCRQWLPCVWHHRRQSTGHYLAPKQFLISHGALLLYRVRRMGDSLVWCVCCWLSSRIRGRGRRWWQHMAAAIGQSEQRIEG
ncbi:uncharacterized protein LOC131024721 [Salvia miltiorrhiza]|uniref:uncharacterized protein LOC131024721 n=1 Tax=Salvia miltiorrhiza TaxID=226208 RepID=UPI0025AD59A6|nr:uncharacterized protein LOC131024721 [Salvia miltiorrhiza]